MTLESEVDWDATGAREGLAQTQGWLVSRATLTGYEAQAYRYEVVLGQTGPGSTLP